MASGTRKRFTCGHRGFGQWCHACEADPKYVATHESSPLAVHYPRTAGWQGANARAARSLNPRGGRS